LRDLDKIQERKIYELGGLGLVKLALVVLVGMAGAFWAGVEVGTKRIPVIGGAVMPEPVSDATRRMEPEPTRFSYDRVLAEPPAAPSALPGIVASAQAAPAAATAPVPAPATETPATGPRPVEVALRPLDSPPEPVASAPAPPAPPKQVAPRYTLQVKAFRAEGDAASLTEQLRANGYDAFVVESNIPDQGEWHRVRVGRFGSLSEATRYQETFEAREGFSTLVSPL
jgi:cell division septation protein DedD